MMDHARWLLVVSICWLARSGTDGTRSAFAQAPAAATDSLGDPLPPGALLRFGTVRFRPASGVSELALSPDGKTLVTIGNRVIVWNPETGQELWRDKPDQFGREAQGSRYGARPLAFATDSSQFYTTNGPTQIAIWDIAAKKQDLLTIRTSKADAAKMRDKTLSLDVTPDGKKFALGRADSILVFDRDGEVQYEIVNSVDEPLRNENRDRLAFFGHYSYVRFAPNGAALAVVTSDRPDQIRIHDAETGGETQTLALAAKLVRLEFSPDSKRIVTTERDNAIRLYDAESGDRLWSHVVELKNPFENYTSAVVFSPDGKTVAAAATDNQIYLLDSSTGEEVGRLTGHHWYPWTLTFTTDGETLYSSGWDGTIRRWDVAGLRQRPLPQGIHATEVVAASPDGRTLAWQDDAWTIHLADAKTGAELRQIASPGLRFSQLQFSPDGEYLAGGGKTSDQVQVGVWNVATGERFRHWTWPKGRDPHSQVEALSFTPDGRRLAAAVFRQSAAYIWDLPNDQQVAQLKHGQIYGLSFSPDGETLSTAGWDSIVRFWETETGELRREFKVSTEQDDNAPKFRIAPKVGEKPNLHVRGGDLRMYAVCYAPEGGLIATAHMDGEVWIWQADNMEPRMKIQMDGGFVYGPLSFSPDGLWLATGLSSGAIRLWEPLSGKVVWDRGRHQHHTYTVGFGRDSRTLVSGADDGICYRWDLRPPGDRPQQDDPVKLWDDLAGEDGAAAYQAMWTLSDSPDRAVELLAEKLRSVRSVIDPDVVDDGLSPEEQERRSRLKALLAKKEAKVELAIVVRRAVALLAQLGTPAAKGLLEELAARDPEGDVGKLSAAALSRFSIAD